LPFPVEREFGTVKFGKRTPSTESPVKRSKAMVEQLKSAHIFKDYQEAFRETTGMPFGRVTQTGPPKQLVWMG
jgi:hypothetical protein